MKRGALIILEGCDRSGKSTQAKLLVDALLKRNISAKFRRFPERSTSIGKTISEYLSNNVNFDDHSIHLLFSANRWELCSAMKKELESGISLIVDRYAFSGVAFTAAKGIDLQWCKEPDIGLIKPDAVFYIDLPHDILLSRIDSTCSTERYENIAFQSKVNECFMQLKDKTWKVIDGNRTIEEVHAELIDLSTSVIKSSASVALEQLWTTHPEGRNRFDSCGNSSSSSQSSSDSCSLENESDAV